MMWGTSARAGPPVLSPVSTVLSLQKQLVLQAVEEDQAGNWAAALSHYCSALEHFVPAIHCKSTSTLVLSGPSQTSRILLMKLPAGSPQTRRSGSAKMPSGRR